MLQGMDCMHGKPGIHIPTACVAFVVGANWQLVTAKFTQMIGSVC